MGISAKNRIRLNRRRFNIRKIVTIKNAVILGVVLAATFTISSVITANALKNKVASSTIVYKGDSQNIELNKNNENKSDVNDIEDSKELKFETSPSVEVDGNENIESIEVSSLETKSKGITLNLLGEIMMGGQVSSHLQYSYSTSIKNIYSVTRTTDFTYGNFSTNITNLSKIEDAKSKYLVTKEVISALQALGLDAVSIASDHITDYSSDIIKNTINILESSDIFVAGREDTPVYFEKDGKKIAIVSTNSVIIGTAKNYSNEGISTYLKDNMKKNIEEAKDMADIVIADIHWGRDHTYGVTNQMREIAKSAIDFGADMVIGSHALGVYPIVKYNDKPIIYSTGYLITDLDYNVAKEGFIFRINIDENLKINSLEMTPTYVENKSAVRLYNEYDNQKCDAYLQQFNKWHLENGLDSKIENEKIVINF